MSVSSFCDVYVFICLFVCFSVSHQSGVQRQALDIGERRRAPSAFLRAITDDSRKSRFQTKHSISACIKNKAAAAYSCQPCSVSRPQPQLEAPVRSPLTLRRTMVCSRLRPLLQRSQSVSLSLQIHTRTPSLHSSVTKNIKRCTENVLLELVAHHAEETPETSTCLSLCFAAVHSRPTREAFQRRGGVRGKPGVHR